MGEEWREVPGFPKYQASSLGNIRNLNGLVLKHRVHDTGYCQLNLCNENGNKTFLVHRAIALTFIENPYNKPHVNHKNGIKTDNRVDNLEWVTVSENHIHAYRELNRTRAGAPKVGVRCIETGRVFSSTVEVYEELGIHQPSISNAINGKVKSAGGFTWERVLSQ